VQAPFNDLAAVASALERWPGEIACILVEPVAGNMGCVPPEPGFLAGLRALASEHGALLVFDEVMTGFRLALGGAQQVYGVRPDLTCLGKIVGGGLPAAAYGGRADIMAMVAPEGPVYQAGTLSGNPLAMAAGATLLDLLATPGTYEALEAKSARLEAGLRRAARDASATVTINRVGSMITVFFCAGPVTDYASAKASDTGRFARFFHAMLERGVYLPPGQFEAAFVSLAHGEGEIDATVDAAVEAFRAASGR
jgi:glutamate-1-semialdehyde 2,1-aminomutase